MKLRLGRKAAELAVTPEVVGPTDTVRVAIDVAKAVDGPARVVLGYDNEYPYRWAGRRDAALRHDDMALVQTTTGTDYGSDRFTTDWVEVLAADLPGERLEPGAHAAEVRVPSWAPGSSEAYVRWQVRLEAGGKVVADAPLRVLVGPPATPPEGLRTTVRGGDVATVDIRPDQSWVRAGETMTGTVTVTVADGYPDECKVYGTFHRQIESHPLERAPAQDREGRDDDNVTLADRLAVTPGVPVELPFAFPILATAAPTTETVHATVSWWLQVIVMPRGFNATGPTTARREVVVHTA